MTKGLEEMMTLDNRDSSNNKSGRISNSKVIMTKQYIETLNTTGNNNNNSNMPKQYNPNMNKTPEP
jgi:hypothetical protein